MNRFGLVVAGLVVMLAAGVVLVANALGTRGTEAVDTTTSSLAATTTLALTSTTSTSGSSTSSIDATSTSTATTTPEATSTTAPAPTTTAAPTTTSTIPQFSSSITTPTEAQLHASWEPGCPLGPADLKLITMTHWNYAGTISTGKIVVAAGLANQVIAIFEDLYAAGFPIERMDLVDNYGGDDDASMAANNTSAFNCRLVTGGSTYSEHSYGRAIDLNPLVNPYVKGSTVLPPEGAQYADRSLDAPGMIHPGDEVVAAFSARGWIWGGTWSSLKDYQHFSTTGN